ncbi:MAG: hypothetical protein ABUR63_08185, partial [Verrucomicrobiota bacterium]
RTLQGSIARRSPAADLSTRTVHVEVDVPDPERTLPVGTTAEMTIDVGAPQPAAEIPLVAASVRGDKATLYTIDGASVAHKAVFGVLGERGGSLFVQPKLAAGTPVVTEGRTLLKDGDRVAAKLIESSERPPNDGGDGVQLAGVSR